MKCWKNRVATILVGTIMLDALINYAAERFDPIPNGS
jgi:hypothetical protein